MRINFAGLVLAAFVLAACSSDGNNTGSTGSTGQSTSSGSSQVATAPQGPQPGSQLDLEVNVGDRVFYAFDSSALSPEARTTIERWAAWMKTYPSNRVIVEGHADERGTREYNLALGERRADSARDYLVSLGVDPNRVQIVSFGKERPAVPGSNERAWAQNRRSVLVLDN